jgi:hypothetical protein
VLDTFVIAMSRLAGLRHPDRLGAWLHAVARNECLRRLCLCGGTALPAPSGGVPPPRTPLADPLPTRELPAPPGPPDRLRGLVLSACTDSTPAGRAYRVSTAHRAGPFGRTGFPKPIRPVGPRWRPGHRRVAVIVAALAAVATAAGTLAVLTDGGAHREHVSALVPRSGAPTAPSAAASTSSSPGHKVRAKVPVARSTPSAPVYAAGGATSADQSTAPAWLAPGPSSVAASPAPSAASPSPTASPLTRASPSNREDSQLPCC